MKDNLHSSFAFVDGHGRTIKAVRHINPDGSLGGWVASTAKVGLGAFIEPGALIEPEAVVRPGQHVRKNERIVEPKLD